MACGLVLACDMLKAYLDDSGTHDGSPVVVVGGLLGLVEDWCKLEAAWRAKLANPCEGKPPIATFSVGKCVHRRKPFQDYDRSERESLRDEFRKLIISSGLRQLSFAIPLADWDRLVVPPYRDFMGSAEEACFYSFIERSVEIIRPIPNSERIRIEFIYDKGATRGRVREVAELFERSKYKHPQVGSIRFEAVADHPGLQAADSIATENFWAVQKYIAHADVARASAQFRELCGEMAGEGFLLDCDDIQAEIDRRGSDGRLF